MSRKEKITIPVQINKEKVIQLHLGLMKLVNPPTTRLVVEQIKRRIIKKPYLQIYFLDQVLKY